ncbi:MAG: hypothetical protein OXH69_18340 [Acidobacteria bacterium]|nr:hypothetical protein [Acidobacteriota bacterium]
MSCRMIRPLALPALALAALAHAAAPVAGQGPEGGASGAPRTAWGDPDLQGIWSSSGATPMERPDEFQGRERLTDEEVARLRGEIAARNDELAQAEARRTQAGGNVGAYNNFWMERGVRSNRTSMIVDPPDGRFPPLTEAGKYARDNQPRGDDTWEDRHIWERCLTRGGMPNAMFPRSYNNNMQVFQVPGYVVMLLEQVHELRVVPLDGRPHIASNIGQWNGDARGHWEGDTLVVETTNLDPRVSGLQPWSAFSSYDGSGEDMRLVERFTRTGPDSLEYEVEVHDPQMYTRPWTVAYPFALSSDVMYEYACHEGNIGMEGILAGGRAEDAEEAAAARP